MREAGEGLGFQTSMEFRVRLSQNKIRVEILSFNFLMKFSSIVFHRNALKELKRSPLSFA